MDGRQQAREGSGKRERWLLVEVGMCVAQHVRSGCLTATTIAFLVRLPHP